jgi:hypothetical protein
VGEVDQSYEDRSGKLGVFEKVIDNQNISQPVEIKEAGYLLGNGCGRNGCLRQLADFGWIENAAKDTVWQMSQVR